VGTEMVKNFNARIGNIESRLIKLEKFVYKHKAFEGGASGHMSHIYDYTDLTLYEIKQIITNLFSGKIEDVTEKLDGMNIQCTMNNDGKVVFIRNKKDLNSEKGGMDIDDISDRWAGKEHVSKTYLNAADIITKVFKKIGKKFFNPDKNTKILANCECITAGKTNILMYSNAQVDFHNLWIYTREDESSEWKKSEVTNDGINVLEKACENIDGAQLTPHVVISVAEKSSDLLNNYISQINEIFSREGLSDSNSIDEYRIKRFNGVCENQYKWIIRNETGQIALYNRWFNDDKSVSLRELKKIYKDNVNDLSALDKSGYKSIVDSCMRPIDTFFGRLGNSIISLCKGMVNAGSESVVISELKKDLEDIVGKIKSGGSDELNEKLTAQLSRLSELGNIINATEGIVFKYGDRLMKCTGSFAAVNQILGLRFSL
jgi:hypothetical protein